MPEIEIGRLRKLRRRATELLATLVPDLYPFRHEDPKFGFVRRPDKPSPPGDVNVTTTCSCLMGLALANKLHNVYECKDREELRSLIREIFKNVFGAPWMSSGLPEDNAFSTVLVIRLFGFLVEAEVMSLGDLDGIGGRRWEPRLSIGDLPKLSRALVDRNDTFSNFLFGLLQRDVQRKLTDYLASSRDEGKVKDGLAKELDRLIRTSSFYDKERFRDIELSYDAKDLIKKSELDAYQTAKLNRILLHEYYPGQISSQYEGNLKGIALEMSSAPNSFENFGINEYPPSAAVLYWFVDGVSRAGIELSEMAWKNLCVFAANEFSRQRSLVVAKHAAMMDPVAMAMAGCLCSRLRSIGEELRFERPKNHHSMLPSTVELEKSVIELFAEQEGGIWPKYFPLFHYQDAGSNFCFTFELLEAVLFEFGKGPSRLFGEESFVKGLEASVAWCESNRLKFSTNSTNVRTYAGWNSGGNLETLRRGMPESWATAVVHMFLWELIDVVSRHIQHRLLDRYEARTPTTTWNKLQSLMDIDLWLEDKSESLRRTLETSIVKTFREFKGRKAERLRKSAVKESPLSALLFGPPGTSKTEIAKAIAAELDWPLVEIDPSHFVQDTFQKIYVRAEEIFEDVMDMYGVVVLFDEMDALVQKREVDTDTESKFLTTYMLPKLAKLHDRGQLVFLMATNFQASFDDAIKRAGRFDYLLCMGPPTLEEKCRSLHTFFELKEESAETKEAGKTILEYARVEPWLEDQLSLYTFGEFKSLLSQLGSKDQIGTEIKKRGKDEFLKLVKSDSKFVGLKLDDLKRVKKFGKPRRWRRLRELDKVTFDEEKIKSQKLDRIPVVKYVLDWKQSRRQCLHISPAKS